MDEKDIWRAAKLLLDQHGDRAAIEAAMRVDALLDAGDMDGQRVWRRILRAIADLISSDPGGAVHYLRVGPQLRPKQTLPRDSLTSPRSQNGRKPNKQ